MDEIELGPPVLPEEEVVEALEEDREMVERREASRAAEGEAILALARDLGVIGGEVKKTAEVEGEDVSAVSEPTALTLGIYVRPDENRKAASAS
jgi:hypothetical protein